MTTRSFSFAMAAAVLAVASGCATTKPDRIPAIAVPTDIPVALQVPAGQEPYLQVHAVGVQIYECAAKADAPGAWAWQFRSPEATLEDASGKTIGRHFAGPSWASTDGATIVGKVRASLPAPQKGDIAWLLLDIKSRDGQGLLTQTTSVQRIDTEGGSAPATACSAANEKQVERVGYTGTYVFWRLRTN